MVDDGHIKYSRKGGYFVTTKKALFYIIVTVLLSLTVGLLVYQYGPHKETEIIRNANIEEILNKSLNNIPDQDIRLPQNVRPKHYKLILKPNLDDLTFSGKVTIVIESTEKTKYIVLNVDELDLQNITLVGIDSTDIRTKRNVEEAPIEHTTRNLFTRTIPTPVHTENISDTVNYNKSKELTNRNTTLESASDSIVSTQSTSTTTEDYIEKIPEIIHILSRQINKDNFQYKMHLSKPLLPQNVYLLNISFTGKIFEAMHGLQQNIYVTTKGKKIYTIASHMQPVFARKVFPCFDEPSMKATYEITVVHKDNMISLSNMPLKSKTRGENDWIEDNFEISPPMSTYLVSIILLDLEYSSAVIRDFNTSIWALDDHLAYAENPLSDTGKILKYYSEYFNMTYPLSKLDIVAIPTLLSTATENWGLIFYKESALLNGADDREIFSVLAKKLAQQWFGNLVSIKWWTDLWQVKGFALLMAEEAASSIYNWTSEFSLKITQKTLALDDFESSPKLETDIRNTLEISQLFESATHYKGSCLFRMLKDSLPDDLFKKSVQEFIYKWQYKSINQYNFWQRIQINAKEYLPKNKNVTEIMKTWTTQTGYPLITVIRDKKTDALNITQNKFHHNNDSSDSSNLWIIPLNYIIGNGEERKLWLTDRSITITNISSDKWILFNVKRTGYYRVNYDKENWNSLINILDTNHTAIPIDNRGQLINDAFKLAENGQLDYQVALNLTSYLQNETDYIPWASALESLQFIKQILQSTYLNGAYEEYIIKLISGVYDNLKSINIDDQLKKLIISTACDVNYGPCINWAKYSFKNWMNDSIPIPYNLRETVFCSVIKHGGKSEWDTMWNEIKIQKSNSDIEELFMSLGCTRDTWLINKYMRNALSGTIPWQNVPYVWKSLSQPTSLTFGFKYLREHWTRIYQTYKDKPLILKTIVTNFLYALSNKSDLDDLTLLVSQHEKDLQQLASLIQGVVDRIRRRVTWSDKYMIQFDRLLSQYNN